MASYPVTVYRWDDPGAPQIGNGRASDIINIWQKCLVDGYGDKDPLGWARPFYDAVTQRAIYRNNVAAGGSGGYAMLFSNTLNDAEYNVMRLSHAKSMTDINTAIGQGFTKAFQVTNVSGNLRRTKWVLIGTAIGFYFSISYDNFQLNGGTQTGLPSMFVGDFFSRTPNDAGRFVADCSPSISSDTATPSTFSLDILSLNNNIAGVVNTLRIYATNNADTFLSYPFFFYKNTSSSVDITLESDVPQILTPIGIGFSGAPTQAQLNDTQNPFYRGHLPGIFLALNPYRGTRTYPTIISHGGQDYWLMRTYNGAPAALINMEVWDDPFV